ncbi:hypothetical protein P5673_030810 [Acropora cervicornis]|uniref:DUF5641 domain-containing protein n=1 Tax=Acropora cervicornis TaxID=6130 RepID=A0AAD9UT27_ACRCE|nr:hypothetical protein P5673_030810 [Acropora cervicornis]
MEVTPRRAWKLVLLTYQGADGLMRKARIKTATSIYDRPIHKLCLIATKQESCTKAPMMESVGSCSPGALLAAAGTTRSLPAKTFLMYLPVIPSLFTRCTSRFLGSYRAVWPPLIGMETDSGTTCFKGTYSIDFLCHLMRNLRPRCAWLNHQADGVHLDRFRPGSLVQRANGVIITKLRDNVDAILGCSRDTVFVLKRLLAPCLVGSSTLVAVRDAFVRFITVVNGECLRIRLLILLLPDPKHAIHVGVMQEENWVVRSHLVCTHVTICSFNWAIPYEVAQRILFDASIFIGFRLCESTYGHIGRLSIIRTSDAGVWVPAGLIASFFLVKLAIWTRGATYVLFTLTPTQWNSTLFEWHAMLAKRQSNTASVREMETQTDLFVSFVSSRFVLSRTLLYESQGGTLNFGLQTSSDFRLQTSDFRGVECRKQRRLRRRRYGTPGPNFLWHVDGWDKFAPYGTFSGTVFPDEFSG